MSERFIMVIVMCATHTEARRISGVLLKKKLAACANIISGIESKFWWKGSIDSAKETLVIAKTLRKNFKKIEAEVRRLHSYDVPEIIAVPVIAGSKNYLKWLEDSVNG